MSAQRRHPLLQGQFGLISGLHGADPCPRKERFISVTRGPEEGVELREGGQPASGEACSEAFGQCPCPALTLRPEEIVCGFEVYPEGRQGLRKALLRKQEQHPAVEREVVL